MSIIVETKSSSDCVAFRCLLLVVLQFPIAFHNSFYALMCIEATACDLLPLTRSFTVQ